MRLLIFSYTYVNIILLLCQICTKSKLVRTMSKPKLWNFGGARGIRNVWAFEELGVDFEYIAAVQGKLEGLPGAQRVPCADFGDGQLMFESGAIIEFTVEKYGQGKLSGTADERREYLQWIHYGETATQAARTPSVLGAFNPDITLAEAQEETRKRLHLAFQGYEDHLGDGREYLLKSGFSAADIMNGWGIVLFPDFIKLDLSKFPRVQAYRTRLMSRDGFKRAWEYRKIQPKARL